MIRSKLVHTVEFKLILVNLFIVIGLKLIQYLICLSAIYINDQSIENKNGSIVSNEQIYTLTKNNFR